MAAMKTTVDQYRQKLAIPVLAEPGAGLVFFETSRSRSAH
jgi:hypothetical protein